MSSPQVDILRVLENHIDFLHRDLGKATKLHDWLKENPEICDKLEKYVDIFRKYFFKDCYVPRSK